MTDTTFRPPPAHAPVLLAVGGLVALAAAMGIGRFIYTPILPLMVEGVGLSQGQAGLIASANFAGYLLGAIAAATPGLPGSRRGWFLGALAASALTTAAMAFDAGASYFALVRFLGGGASAFVLVHSSTLVLDRLAASGRGALAATHFAGVGVGIAASAILMLALAPLGGGWRAAWLAAGALSAVALLAATVFVPSGDGPRAPRSAGVRRGKFGPGFAWLLAAYGLVGFGYVITATFLVALVRAGDATRPIEPYVWLMVGAAAAPSVALWTWCGRSFGVHRAFAAACVVEAIGVAASVLWPTIAGIIIAAIFLGGTFVGLTALGLIGARSLAPSQPHRALGLMTASFGAGQIIGPSFAGFLYDATGSFALPTLGAAAALMISAAMALAAGRIQYRSTQQPDP